MKTIERVRELVMDIYKGAMEEPVMEEWQFEEWLDENSKWRSFCEYINGDDVEFDMNMTVRDLKVILNKIEDDDMNVIIPVLDQEDTCRMHGFRHVRTAGILKNKFEEKHALCLSAPGNGMDMYSQLDYNDMGSVTTCQQGLF